MHTLGKWRKQWQLHKHDGISGYQSPSNNKEYYIFLSKLMRNGKRHFVPHSVHAVYVVIAPHACAVLICFANGHNYGAK